MRRNLAQSLFEHGQIETTLIKAKEVRRFAEKLITAARENTLASRRRVIAMLGDRSVIPADQQEAYDLMSDARRQRVLMNRSGRRHRSGSVPASYNKKKIPFVAVSIVNKLIDEVAPRYKDRPGGYTRIIRLPKRRIGDGSDLAILQLVGPDEERPAREKNRRLSRRRTMTANRMARLEGKAPRKGRTSGRSSAKAESGQGGETSEAT
jgi:large subunit ribosomal protein L17